MRKQPGSPSSTTPKINTDVITQVREYELITPLFGGGVHPKEADLVTIIRGSEIRGNLRFWWRTSRGGQYSDWAAMKKGEDSLWGKAHKKDEKGLSPDKTVHIVVEVLSRGTGFTIFDKNGRFDRNSKVPDYAAFPLQPDDRQKKQQDYEPPKIHSNVSFKLTISFPNSRKQDVESALWAWETFGGIGGRTRRGFGALRCTSIKEKDHSVPLDLPEANPEKAIQWLQRKTLQCVVNGSWPDNVPHLIKQYSTDKYIKLIARNDKRSASDAWGTFIEKLKTFRQARYTSTQEKANHPGRSKWPEPSAIRQLTDQSQPRHTNSIPNPPIKKFPRAVFGLPIIFQFKDSNKRYPDDKNSDPRKTALRPLLYERFASPLILKPLSCQGGEFLGLATILEGVRIKEEELILESQEGFSQFWNVEANLEPSETLNFTVLAQQVKIDNQVDVLQAFINYL